MKTLTVQIQAGLAGAHEIEHAIGQLLALAGEKLAALGAEAPRVERHPGQDWINVNFRARDTGGLWHAIQEKLGLAQGNRPPIANALIVVCEGEYGWDDYQLLHHFDEFETPDVL